MGLRVCARGRMSDKGDLKVLKCFGHVKRMIGGRSTKIAYKSEVEDRRDRVKPCTKCSWMELLRHAMRGHPS